ncbi:MFS transporter [Amycolatopsis jiangsuensis]|uniref:MFS family permease n=1 Tax=Amycolatopsis jiangsuensis TaxID=1181879 RepID=A0A840IT53_9PSEU|nr:MFS transporter [Amycolatopsis jiangsuensis]MBB4684392.1 MFS family permease [Amycolatopsis jiangsuensis]
MSPRPSRYPQFAIPLALLGFSIALVPPLVITIALRLRELDLTGAAADLGLILGVGAFFSLLANPLAGRFSDRTTSRLGMRKPWIFSGAAIGYAGIVLIAFAPSVPVVLIGWSIAQIGLNFALAALVAMLPDQIGPGRRGRTASFISLAQNVGGVAATFFVQLFPAGLGQYLVPSLIGTVLMVAVIAPVKDRVRPAGPREPFDLRSLFGSFVFNPRKYPDLGWAWLTRFFLTTTQFTATSYLTYFLIAQFGVSDEDAPTLVFQAILANAIGIVLVAPLLGWLSDRLRRRKLFVIISSVIAIAGLTVIALAPSVSVVFAGELVLGAGLGAFFAVELALIADVLPSAETAGKDLGVANLAQSLPQSLIPVAAPALIASFGYLGLFLGGAVFGVLGAISVTRVRKVR